MSPDAGRSHGVGTPVGVGFVLLRSVDVQKACSDSGGMGSYLTPAERSARDAFHRPQDALDYAASHVLLRLMAAHQLGLEASAAPYLEITRHCVSCGSVDHGRPVLAGASLSLSRSHGVAMAAAGPVDAFVGVDVEQIPAQLFAGFEDYVLTAKAAADLPQEDIVGRMRHWVAKEAVLKSAGIGLAVAPSAVALTERKGPLGSLRATCPQEPMVHGRDVYSVPALPGYLAALSSSGWGAPRQCHAHEILPTSSTSS